MKKKKENGESDRSKNWTWTHNNPPTETHEDENGTLIKSAEENWHDLLYKADSSGI